MTRSAAARIKRARRFMSSPSFSIAENIGRSSCIMQEGSSPSSLQPSSASFPPGSRRFFWKFFCRPRRLRLSSWWTCDESPGGSRMSASAAWRIHSRLSCRTCSFRVGGGSINRCVTRYRAWSSRTTRPHSQDRQRIWESYPRESGGRGNSKADRNRPGNRAP